MGLMHIALSFLDEVKTADEASTKYKELSEKYFRKALQFLPAGYETPEEYEERTGEAWPDNLAVYALYENNDGEKKWVCGIHGIERKRAIKHKKSKMIVIAAEREPPPDDWRSEETGNDV
jgi:hypothetical protein